ncbi:MAG: hypothetical protein ACE5E9_11625 [Nitrospinaceae bacterium]
MLAFAKDITQDNPQHRDEANNPKLKEYMDYQRKLNHEKLIYHALDHAKTYLQKNIEECKEDPQKLGAYLQKAFPVSFPLVKEADTFLLMLRKLINGHNSTNNWYRMNPYYFAVVYDCMERFVRLYNRLLGEKPDEAEKYGVSDGVEVDFDDWVQLYFHDLDFMVGKDCKYVHYLFNQRNEKIQELMDEEMRAGKSREAAVDEARKKFEMDPASVNIILGKTVSSKDLELFYTSAENPIYEFLYEPESTGFMDGETLLDHSYFLGQQLKGLNEEEIESIMNEASRLKDN